MNSACRQAMTLYKDTMYIMNDIMSQNVLSESESFAFG